MLCAPPLAMFASRSSGLLGHLPLIHPPSCLLIFFLVLFFLSLIFKGLFFKLLQISTATPLLAFITLGSQIYRTIYTSHPKAWSLIFFFFSSGGNQWLGHGHGPLFKSKSHNAQTFSVLDSIGSNTQKSITNGLFDALY